MNKFARYFLDPKYRFIVHSRLGFHNKMDDKKYVSKFYYSVFGKNLDLENPKTFNEKTQWLKLNIRKDILVSMVDKYEAKNYISSIIGDEHLIKTLGVWDKFEDIDFNSLPDKFVLKTTHDSGGVVVCEDKKTFNIKKARRKIKKSLKKNYYYNLREWPYKFVKPRVIAEEYICLNNGGISPEYKLFCFNGTAKLVLVCQGIAHENSRTNTFFDLEFRRIPVDTVYKRCDDKIEKPSYFNEMVRIAEILSKDFEFLRVDFYCLENTFYIGELTLYHNGGLCPFDPPEYDLEFGELIKLPCEKE